MSLRGCIARFGRMPRRKRMSSLSNGFTQRPVHQRRIEYGEEDGRDPRADHAEVIAHSCHKRRQLNARRTAQMISSTK